jgi:hypothetical protein
MRTHNLKHFFYYAIKCNFFSQSRFYQKFDFARIEEYIKIQNRPNNNSELISFNLPVTDFAWVNPQCNVHFTQAIIDVDIHVF